MAERNGSFKKLVVILIAALSMAAVVTMGRQGLAEVFRLSNQRDALRAETIALLERNQRIICDIERLKNEPLAAEEVARAELGLAKPEEIMYVFKSTPSRLDRRGPDAGQRYSSKNQN